MNKNVFYEESGKFEIIGLLFYFLTGLVLSVIVGFIYGWVIYSSNFNWTGIPLLDELGLVFGNILFSLPFGAVIGFIAGKLAKPAKIRNSGLRKSAAIFFGILVANLGWIFWLNLANNHPIFSFHFSDLMAAFNSAAQHDLGTLFGWTPAGFALIIIWLLRGLLIIGMAFITVEIGKPSLPFCENCNVWTDTTLLTTILDIPKNEIDFLNQLKNGNFDYLFSLRNIDPWSARRLKVEVHECAKCGEKHYLSVYKTISAKDENEETSEDEKPLVKNLIITKETFEKILDWRNKLSSTFTK